MIRVLNVSFLRSRKFLSNQGVSTSSSFFYISFRSLLINTRLVFISYLVSVPLRKGHRGLKYKCSSVLLYLFLFAFLIICIKSFGFVRFFFAFLIIYIETFGCRRLFCNTSLLDKRVVF